MLGTEARRHYHRPWQAVASLPNPRRCRRFSHLRKHRRRDRSGPLGGQDSKLGMAEIKSTWFGLDFKDHSGKTAKIDPRPINRFDAESAYARRPADGV